MLKRIKIIIVFFGNGNSGIFFILKWRMVRCCNFWVDKVNI